MNRVRIGAGGRLGCCDGTGDERVLGCVERRVRGPVEGGGRRLGQVGTADRVAEVDPALRGWCSTRRSPFISAITSSARSSLVLPPNSTLSPTSAAADSIRSRPRGNDAPAAAVALRKARRFRERIERPVTRFGISEFGTCSFALRRAFSQRFSRLLRSETPATLQGSGRIRMECSSTTL